MTRNGTAAFTIDFATADGTAKAGEDYVARSGTLSFAAGQAAQAVSVTINGDTTVEPHETFVLNLTNASNGGIIIDGQGLGTITDDDGAPGIFEKRVASGLDDVEQRASGKMVMTSSDLELVDDGSYVGQSVGLRFTGIDIPQGATITKAYLQFYADEVGSAATLLLIRGEDADDAAAFVNVNNNVSSRPTTDAAAAWTPAAWTAVGEAGLAQRTSDLSAIVQEIVARPGWLAGNDMAFVITGSGTRTAEAFEGGAAKAPLLHIEYVLAGSNADPVVGNISINDVTIAEGNSGTKTAIFTVTRTGTAAFTVDFATADGTAAAGADYAANSGTLTFAAGQAAQTVSVTINGDTTVEGDETFFLNLTNASNGGSIVDGQGLGTIINDDAAPVVGEISINDVTIVEGNSGTKTATFTVSRTGTAAFTVDFATADGTAKAGSDYLATSGTLNFAAGEGAKTVSVTINGDTTVEPNETFFLNLSNATNGGTFVDGQGLGTITNDDAPTPSSPTVVKVHDTRPIGSGDPAGLAYIPTSGTLFLSDSEHDESPYFSPINLHALQTDGTLVKSYSVTSFTNEPTGLAFDPTTGHLFISDDSKYRVFRVDPANPTLKLVEFQTKPLGGDDPEDLAINPKNGHLFIVNGISRTIVETNNTGTQVFSNITLPQEISDPEALAYDARQDVFYVGGGFSYKIWKVGRSGDILSTIDILSSYRNPTSGIRPKVKDIELAPSSDPNDDPGKLNLYVADYGADQVNNGRLFELNVGDLFWV